MAYSNNAQILLTRESEELERRIIPITQELNEFALRVNCLTWVINKESAEESAHFLIDFCRYLADDDWFRPNSTADCARALFDNKGRKPTKISKKSGLPLTDKDVLTDLANHGDPLAPVIIDARSAIVRMGQLRTWEPYARAGCVQATWDSLGCPHGRYASAGPCLNNRIVPIRETIEAEEGYTFLSLDLSQAELVVWASLSGDLAMGQSFMEGRDFHTETAKEIKAAVPSWDLHGQTERAAGKTLNFAILYLMQNYTLARKLGCSVETADKIQKVYFQRAEVAHRYTERVLAVAKERGFIETFYGRRRYCPEYTNATSERETHEVEKTLWNHLIAGTAAEYLKFKQLASWELLRKEGYGPEHVRLVINNYDECIFTIKTELLRGVQELIEGVWKRKEPGFLPFNVGIKSGVTWGECSK